MTKNELLEAFGQTVISEVRDEAIEKYQMISTGNLKSEVALDLHKQIACFTEEQQAIIRKLVVNSIDDVMHNFLWMLEQHADDIELSYSSEDGCRKENINELSDGLSGEIYSEDGWIDNFSHFKDNY